VLAGDTPDPVDDAFGPPGQLFQSIAGTSMSSPYAAGVAALILSVHPGWTPGQVWTAPTAWSARALAELGERHAADRLLRELRRAETPAGTLPERVDASSGAPTSTTPLAWSHAFAILALRARYGG
jgi:subtilisin family serine protease